ncbi:MAG TPA: LLM class flavin-dependent oxidoreductase [Roseiflexaceae bacterium]|nr:LLM class flavin-dependent oxidoreductase [Roseiflexaceae bacterium]
MELGIGLPNTLNGASGELLLAWARRADAGPFASLGVFDRLLYHSFDPLISLAAVAGATSRISLATTIIIGPLRNDALLAKEAATLDALSGGRLTLGLALGARRDDYTAAGVDYAARGQRLDQQLAALRGYWEDERFVPHPARPGGPPVLVGGLSDSAYARAARQADGYIHGGGPPKAFAGAAQKARAAWVDAGRAERPQLWGQGYYALGDEADAAAGRAYLLDYYAFTGPFAERIAAGLLTTPQAIAQFVRGYAEAGCDHLVLFPTVARMEQYERLVEVIE